MELIIGTGLRLLVAGCGVALGAVCAVAAYHNGLALDGALGLWFGVGFAAVVVMSWLMWPVASWSARLGNTGQAKACKIAWAPLALFVVANAVMFVASHRTETVGGKAMEIERYEVAKAERERLLTELGTVKTSPLWTASSGCTIRTIGAKKLCDRSSEIETGLKEAGKALAAGKPASADAGAETLAWVLGGDAAKVGRAWPIAVAVALELAASFAMKLALSPWGTPRRREAAQGDAVAAPGTLTYVVELVRARPEGVLAASVRELARMTSIPKSTIHERLREWHERGLIVVEQTGGRTRLSLPSN
ncbi:hypothetical protein T281_16075 [Rhodomicrobium udaipurense JA643]|uniref:Uncharacterized protein n=1 Tax=Rhodomicrobium udaipurense TaxID=1202716 RepID=A0A8I1KJU8_9HYPH|nr:hypothetical protein [Rhodomicrobium udaipurense]KAI93549.1 hypothetical protein T281_16075 [Rhodomicrobium udaipurense JA643]MBJ7543294.1 hypothetical protein [Rhodomicrobium udaipurense]